jgi:hypothetical protein
VDRNKLTDLGENLRFLLNHRDPIGVYDERSNFPPDEYDCLIAPLLSRLARGEGVVEISEFLWFELEEHFGLDPAMKASDQFARQLVAWFGSQS